MVKVKICGITRLEDALTASDAGADALGFVFYSRSPRHVTPEQAAEIIGHLPPFVQTVGLFVNEEVSIINSIADQCGLDLIQLHGEETPDYCNAIRRRVIKAFRVKDSSTLDLLAPYNVAGYLLDAWSPAAHGGTGQTFNWEIAAEAAKRGQRIVLAGGLTPDNVAESIRQTCPYGVDVSSGVEAGPGRKDACKVRLFIERAKHS
jgi:phosphoribosylanthranilate isomerase